MAITTVGTFAKASGVGQKTVSVSPTTIGDILVLIVMMQQTVNSVTGVSGGGVTTWVKLILANPNPTNAGDVEIWYGVITTTGASTVTITTGTGTANAIGCQQFTAGAGITWSQDGSGVASTSTTSASSGNYPSITPANTGELYLGALLAMGGAPNGSSAGYTYLQGGTNFVAARAFVYNLSAPNPSSPAWTQTSGPWTAASALLIASSGSSVTANAGVAAATVAGLGATASIVSTAGLASLTAAALTPSGTITGTAGLAAAAATALGISATVAPTAGLANATGTGLAPAITVKSSAGLAGVTGSSLAPSVTVTPTVGIANVAASGLAPTPQISAGTGLATVTISAFNASAGGASSVVAHAGCAQVTVTAGTSAVSIGTAAGCASIVATALNAVPSVGAGAGVASVVVGAFAPVASVQVSAGVGVISIVGYAATVTGGATVPPVAIFKAAARTTMFISASRQVTYAAAPRPHIFQSQGAQ